MTLTRTLLISTLAAMTLGAQAVTYSCKKFGKTFSVDMGSSSDLGYGAIGTGCQQLIDNHWKGFGMEKKYWDEGWGYHDACKHTTPLNRTFRSLELLKISGDSKHGDVILNYAYKRTREWIEDLRVQCAKDKDDSARASHSGGAWEWIGGDNGSGTVTMYLNIFSDNVLGIAGTLLHEARHKKKGHNGGEKCPRKASCDSSWDYSGANAWQVNYLWWYGIYGKNSQKFMRQFALDKARSVHDRGFVTNPGKNIPRYAK